MKEALSIFAIIVCGLSLVILIRNRLLMKKLERKIDANKRKLDEETEKRMQIEKDVISYLRARSVLFKEHDISLLLSQCVERFKLPPGDVKIFYAVNIERAAKLIASQLNKFDEFDKDKRKTERATKRNSL